MWQSSYMFIPEESNLPEVHRQVLLGKTKNAVELLKQSKNKDITDEFGRTALHYAASIGHQKMVQIFAKKSLRNSVDHIDENCKTALVKAIEARSFLCVQTLVNFGCKVKVGDHTGKSPLHHAINTNQLNALSFLAFSGGDINHQDQFGFSPLHAASLLGRYECAEFLLEHHCQVDIQDAKGRTPLMVATSSGNEGLIRLLLEYGASLCVYDAEGRRPLDYAFNAGQEIFKVFGNFLKDKKDTNHGAPGVSSDEDDQDNTDEGSGDDGCDKDHRVSEAKKAACETVADNEDDPTAVTTEDAFLSDEEEDGGETEDDSSYKETDCESEEVSEEESEEEEEEESEAEIGEEIGEESEIGDEVENEEESAEDSPAASELENEEASEVFSEDSMEEYTEDTSEEKCEDTTEEECVGSSEVESEVVSETEDSGTSAEESDEESYDSSECGRAVEEMLLDLEEIDGNTSRPRKRARAVETTFVRSERKRIAAATFTPFAPRRKVVRREMLDPLECEKAVEVILNELEKEATPFLSDEIFKDDDAANEEMWDSEECEKAVESILHEFDEETSPVVTEKSFAKSVLCDLIGIENVLPFPDAETLSQSEDVSFMPCEEMILGGEENIVLPDAFELFPADNGPSLLDGNNAFLFDDDCPNGIDSAFFLSDADKLMEVEKLASWLDEKSFTGLNNFVSFYDMENFVGVQSFPSLLDTEINKISSPISRKRAAGVSLDYLRLGKAARLH